MFDDPLADGEEAQQALRVLAHATCTFVSPSQTYGVIGEDGTAARIDVLPEPAAATTRTQSRSSSTMASTLSISVP